MSAPALEHVGHDMPLERVPPVNRELPPLRPARRPPLASASLAVLGALLAGLVASMGPTAPLTWTVAEGSLATADGELGTDAVAPADTELVAGAGGAVLRAQGVRVDLAPGTVLELGEVIGPVSQTLRLREGSLVADVDATLAVDATVATITGFGGAFRVDRGDTPRVATYDAAVGISGDTAVSMTALHQLPLGDTQDAVGPIILDPEDPWDVRHAPGPLETDAQLADLLTGLRASYGEVAQTAAFYTDFVGVTEGLVAALPQLAPVDEGDRFGPPAETLVAAAAVTSLVEASGRPLQDLVPEVVAARAAGGTWGVVLAQREVDAAYLRRVTDEALRRRREQPSPAPVLTEEQVTPSSPETSPQPSPTQDPTPEPSPQPEPSPEPSPSQPEPEPSPSPEPDPLEDPVGTIDDLLDPEGGLIGPGSAGEALGSVLDEGTPLGARDRSRAGVRWRRGL